MPYIKIGDLTTFTGDTSGSWIVMNDETNATTYKVQKETYFTSSLYGTASYALTASYVANASSFPYTGSAAISGSLNVVGPVQVTGNITASNALLTGTITAQTLVVQTITSSVEFVTGSTKFGSRLTDTHQFTGSVNVTSSLIVNGNVGINTSSPRAPLEVVGNIIAKSGSNLVIYNPETGWSGAMTVNDGYHTVLNGKAAGIDGGTGQIAIGGTVTADTNGSNFNIALGYSTYCTTNPLRSIAIGYQAIANGTNTVALGYGANAPEGTFVLNAGGAERMRIDSSGNLMIGHPTSSYKFQVSGSGASGSLNVNNVLYVSGSSVQVTGSLSVSSGITGSLFGTSSWAQNVPASGVTGLNLSQIATGSISASVNVNSASFQITSGSSTFLFVSNSGRVNIGTTSSTAALTVGGGSLVVGSGYGYGTTYGSTSDGILQITDANAALLAGGSYPTQIVLRQAGNVANQNSNYWGTIEQSAGGMLINSGKYLALYLRAGGVGSTQDTYFQQSNTATSMTIKGSTSNVLIGTTTDSGYKLLVATSGASGSLNVNNVLVVSGSSVQVTGSLSVTGSVTAAAAIGRGVNLTNTLVASNVGDVLVGIDVQPTFSNPIAYGNVQYLSARFGSSVSITGGLGAQASALSVGGTIAAASAAGRGLLLTTTLQAAANSDYLVALDVSPTFTNGAFSSINQFFARFANTNGGTSLPASSGTVQAGGILRLGRDNAILDIGSNSSSGAWIQSTNRTNLGVGYPIYLNPNGGNILIASTTDTGYRLLVSGSGTAGSLNAGDTLYVSGSRVGIGTNAPSYSLDISGTARLVSSGVTRFYIDTTNVSPNIGFALTSGSISKWSVASYKPTGTNLSLVFFNDQTNTNSLFIHGDTNNVIIGSTTDSGYKLDVSGSTRVQDNLLVSKNQNGGTSITVSNTTSGAASSTSIILTSSGGSGQIAKYSSTTTPYKTVLADDFYLYNATAGDISILNDYASGKIKLTAGGSSTAHVTIFSTGNTAIGSTTDTGHKLLVSGSGASGSLNVDNTLYVSGSNVGIGTSSPSSYKLDVNGTARVSGDLTLAASGVVRVGTTNRWIGPTSYNSGIEIYSAATGPDSVKITTTNQLNLSSIGPFTANTTAIMQIDSTTKGILIPRMTSAQRIAVATPPAQGLQVYDTDSTTEGIWYYNSGSFKAWTRVLNDSGSQTITGSLNATLSVSSSQVLISGSGVSRLTIVGSGSSSPLMTVIGSQGELFSVNDTLSGSLFSVNDISGLPVLEAFSDNRVLLGSYQAPALYTTVKVNSVAGNNVIYQNLPTASYDGLFVSYTARSGSNVKVGQLTGMWSASAVLFTEFGTSSFGDVTGLGFTMIVTGSNMAVTASTSTANWSIKTIIRSV